MCIYGSSVLNFQYEKDFFKDMLSQNGISVPSPTEIRKGSKQPPVSGVAFFLLSPTLPPPPLSPSLLPFLP